MTTRAIISGGGLAGLVCADELTRALRARGEHVEVSVLEDGDAGASGEPLRAADPVVRELHPFAPERAPRSRGVHLLSAGDDAARGWLEESGAFLASPSSCWVWLGPPDVAGGPHVPARLVELRAGVAHVEASDDPPLVRLIEDGGPLAEWLGELLEETLGLKDVRGLLLSLDTLLRTGELSSGFRWGAALLVELACRVTEPDDDEGVRELLGGRRASDVDARELVEALVRERLLPGFAKALEALPGVQAGELDELMNDLRVLDLPDLDESLTSVLPVVELLVNDAVDGLEAPLDPRSSSLFEVYLGGGRPWPFGLDARTALGWLRRRKGAPASAGATLVDDAAVEESLRALRERIEARLEAEPSGGFLESTWASRVLFFGERASAVEVTDNVERMPELVPTVRAARRGIPTATLEADLVLCAQPPRLLSPLLDDVEHEGMRALRRRLGALARHDEEPLSLRLFFPEKLELLPEGEACALHGLSGPFHTLLDLERAFGEGFLDAVALGGREGERRLYGSAFELQGTWASAFWSRACMSPPDVDGKPSWPPAVRELLRRLAEDPADFEPATLDRRRPLTGGDATLPAPMLGEVKGLERTRYLERWIEEVAPVVVSQALYELASLPHLDEPSRARLEDEAERVAEERRPRVRYILQRGCQAETRTPSYPPGRRRTLLDDAVAPYREGADGLVLASGALSDEAGVISLEAEVRAGRAAAERALSLLDGEG